MLERISAESKDAQLKKWGDEDDFLRDVSDNDFEPHVLHHNPGHLADENIETRHSQNFQHGSNFHLDSNSQLDSNLHLDSNIKTIRMSPQSASKQAFSRGRSPHLRDTSRRATLSPRVLLDFTEEADGDASFEEGFDMSEQDQAKFKQWVSPATISLPSPSNRRSLSSYSEDTDTDITEMDDDDFEEIDDIFGKEESGIYHSSNKGTCAGRAGDILSRRKQQLQKEAELEDRELYYRYHNQNDVATLKSRQKTQAPADEVQTLKLKDLNADDDHTIKYEYTKDDFESIEDGFLGDLCQNIKADRLSHFKTSNSGLQHKMSMPAFPQSLKTFNPARSKSTMDLNGGLESPREHPFFNHNNKLIKKLDRMPSFHSNGHSNGRGDNRREGSDRNRISEKKISEDKISEDKISEKKISENKIKKDKISEKKISENMISENMISEKKRIPLSAEDIDFNMELHKKQLLEKYMEITEKQMQLRSSPKKKKETHAHENVRRNIGLVKFLNDQSYAPIVDNNRKMRFNALAKTWEGNEHDLLRFEEMAAAGGVKKQPGLITNDQFMQRHHKGNMKYDAVNLRWVNMDTVDEESENVFHDVSDLVPDDIPQYARPGLKTSMSRGVSIFTQRTASTSSSNSAKPAAYAGEEYHLSRNVLARFEKEEAKIRKKTHNWFGADETYHLSPAPFDSDYFWDIRKMVIDDTTNEQ